ncbi:uncharacterized protein PAC_00101 [Phialocephala subalpina]|uniref:Uncharacterized protein n=1 Tax=Phialocephala subalpina TaxID=576137 RepID=A0A1L7WC36_9HELO|nr:uncharacterized protein PAC_00101 [Phialocephala subalpina]
MVGLGRDRYIRAEDFQDILDATISSLLGSDWYSRNADLRTAPLRRLTGLTGDERRVEEGIVTDFVRRQNLAVQLANSLVSIYAAVAEVHPKVIDSGPETGHYPRDFEIPRRIDCTLDRILTAYDLTSRVYSDPYSIRDRFRGLSWILDGARSCTRDDTFHDRLLILLEFLGVDARELDRLSDRERLDDRLGRCGGDRVTLSDRIGESLGLRLGLGLGLRRRGEEDDEYEERRWGLGGPGRDANGVLVLLRTRLLSSSTPKLYVKSYTDLSIEDGGWADCWLLQALAGRSDTFDSRAITTEEELLHWCSSLLRKNRISQGLEFAHFTVKEFLLCIDPLQDPTFVEYRLSNDHTILASSRIRFLGCVSFDGNPLPILDEVFYEVETRREQIREKLETDWSLFSGAYRSLEYACTYWTYHVHRCKDDSVHNSVLELVFPKSEKIFQLWIFAWAANWRFNSGDRVLDAIEVIVGYSPLHWAARFSLEGVCSKLLEDGAGVNENSMNGTPLKFALLSATSLDYDVISFLHDEELLLRCRDCDREGRSHELVLRQLLDAGATEFCDTRNTPQNALLDIGIQMNRIVTPRKCLLFHNPISHVSSAAFA